MTLQTKYKSCQAKHRAIFQANFLYSCNVNFFTPMFSLLVDGIHLRSGCHLTCVCFCRCIHVSFLHRKSRFIFITVICWNCDSSTILWNFSRIKQFFLSMLSWFLHTATNIHTQGQAVKRTISIQQVHLINCNWNLSNVASSPFFYGHREEKSHSFFHIIFLLRYDILMVFQAVRCFLFYPVAWFAYRFKKVC